MLESRWLLREQEWGFSEFQEKTNNETKNQKPTKQAKKQGK